jgi:hypothetical protein
MVNIWKSSPLNHHARHMHPAGVICLQEELWHAHAHPFACNLHQHIRTPDQGLLLQRHGRYCLQDYSVRHTAAAVVFPALTDERQKRQHHQGLVITGVTHVSCQLSLQSTSTATTTAGQPNINGCD